MDKLIKRFDSERDSDLRLCLHRGIAYQKDMHAARVAYGADYLKKVEAYEDSDIAKAVNAGRCAMLQRYLPQGSTLLDVGAGSGAFVRAAKKCGYDAKGYDIIPDAVMRLKDKNLFASDPAHFDAITLWDTLEHMDVPSTCIGNVVKGAYAFISIPVFDDLRKIRESRHYRPGEHLYYFTAQGFIDWMELYGFRLLEQSSHETDAGRDSIGAFAFRRDLPDYNDHIAAYDEMHSSRYYGSSATNLHLQQIAGIVQKQAPASILDYGCGRSDLSAHFWLDGKRRIERYDPAIGAFKLIPRGRFDMVLCCDVMEHIPMMSVDRVLKEIHEKSGLVLFTISTKLARARLPDGRNAHVTLLTRSEWINWLTDEFSSVTELPSEWEHELILLAGKK